MARGERGDAGAKELSCPGRYRSENASQGLQKGRLVKKPSRHGAGGWLLGGP